MAKVTNKTARGVSLRGWRILPNSSKVVDRMGGVHKTMPDVDAYCAKGKQLADEGVLELEGYVSNRPKAWTPIVPDPPKDEVVSRDKSKDPTIEVITESKKSKKRPGKK